MGNAIDINNLGQALNENNAKLLNAFSQMSSSDIQVSVENGNGFSLKDDGLYLPDVSSELDGIEEWINSHIKYASGKYTTYINNETKVSQTFTIPINLNFVPKIVFIRYCANAGTQTGYRAYINSTYISSLINSPSLIYYDTNFNSSTSFTVRGVKITIENFSQESISLLIESYQETASAKTTGSSVNVYIDMLSYEWFAIG